MSEELPVSAAPEAALHQDTPAPAPAEPRKLKAKVDGEEVEVTEEEAIRDYERRQASYKRMEEAAKIRKEAEEILNGPKKDLRAFLKKQGITLEALTDIVAAELDEASMTPEQREWAEKERKLKEYEERERKAKEQEESKASTARVEEAKVEFAEKIKTALDSTGLSKDPYTLRSAALFVRTCLQNGFEPDAAEIREAVEGRVRNDYKSQVDGRSGEDLVKWLGEDAVRKIREYDLSRLRAKRVEAPKAEAPKSEAAPPKTHKMDKWAILKQVDEWSKQ